MVLTSALMELEPVHATNATAEVSQLEKSDDKLAVAFNKETESCFIVEDLNKEGDDRDALEPTMGAPDDSGYAGDDSKTVLLHQDMKKSQMQVIFPGVYTFFSSYRSSNPEERVTPFALVLLFVLFLIYVLNQADRLVLAVTIPAGLRCELKASECGENTSVNSSVMLSTSDVTMHNFLDGSDGGVQGESGNSTNDDCIHFSDSQQGLLTGRVDCVLIRCLCDPEPHIGKAC